jgi:hypothetical protein
VTENNQRKSNGRGGKRPGAGRKSGSATKKTREIANKAASEGITPLEFMLDIMRGEPPETEDERVRLSFIEMRFEAAKAAAPYMHPRLQAIEHTGADGGAIEQSLSVEFVGVK